MDIARYILVNIFVLIYFIKNDFKIYLKNNDGNI